MAKATTQQVKIYVAGPYTPATNDVHDAPRAAYRNTRAAILAGLGIMKKGHVPFIPHLMHYVNLEADQVYPVEFYYEYDTVWLKLCDAVLRLPGKSEGAEREVKWAKENGLAVYHSVSTIPRLIRSNSPARPKGRKRR